MLNFEIVDDKKTGKKKLQTSLSGKYLLTIPQLNKGTAFTDQERDMLGLRGKLPMHVEDIEEQVKRAYMQFKSFDTPLQKNVFLNQLDDTNIVLFYRLVQEHTAEMIPILYTPTVGEAVEKFSREFSQARGLYISFDDQDRIEEILSNRSHPNIELIVASDGGGVLGIGDQGAGAMLIPVAKLMVYTICANVNPLNTLPVMLDVGTDNEELLNDPFYLGWRHRRVSGKEYDQFIEKFVSAVKKCFPQVFLHWEDFGRDNARKILNNYRHKIATFNDDIQGTGVVTMSALLAAIQANKSSLQDQRIIIFGGGTAGTGIADQICETMVLNGISIEDARRKFWMIDRPGLLVDNMKDITEGQTDYVRPAAEIDDWQVDDKHNIKLLDVIHNVKPTILIGCSTVFGAFNKDVVEAMCKHAEHPIIFPLSNPTEKAEATPQDVYNWSNGKALIATGSPFPPIEHNGDKLEIAQCNNALVFPGIGLGVIAVKASAVTDNMLWVACEKLSHCAPIHDDPSLPLLPAINDAREAAREIAIAVGEAARKEGVADKSITKSVTECVDEKLWSAEYLPYEKI